MGNSERWRRLNGENKARNSMNLNKMSSNKIGVKSPQPEIKSATSKLAGSLETLYNTLIVFGLSTEDTKNCLTDTYIKETLFYDIGTILQVKFAKLPFEFRFNDLTTDELNGKGIAWVTFQSVAQAEEGLTKIKNTDGIIAAAALNWYCQNIGRRCTTPNCHFLHETYRPPLYLSPQAKKMTLNTKIQVDLEKN